MDFSSWQAVITTLLGLVVVTFVMVGIRLLVMETVQQRRNRENRQINERLRALIAAYKTLGGSFTGDLTVDPTHLRDIRTSAGGRDTEAGADILDSVSSDRSRRIRDAVEGALSDVILLGTEQQVLLAARAAADLVAGRPVHTDQLVISLRDFIRDVLDLEPVPTQLVIPKQGPSRPAGGAKGKGDAGGGDRAGTKQDGKSPGAGGGRDAGGAMGMGLGGGLVQDTEGDP